MFKTMRKTSIFG